MADRPRRIQRRRTRGWRAPEGALYIGRGSRWGNPFAVTATGATVVGPSWWDVKRATLTAPVHLPHDRELPAYVTCSRRTDAVERAVELFRDLCVARRRDLPKVEFDAWVWPLRGRDLMCWCSGDQPCHADVLLEIANQEATDG